MLKGTFLILIAAVCFATSCTKNTREVHTTADKKYTDLVLTDSNDYLIAVFKDSMPELGSACAFINSQHDTMIPFGKYSHCWTDTLKSFAIVYDSANTSGTTVAIDRNEHILFDIVFFDNWPDELHGGLFRVKRNGKIGFANSIGQIIIPCQYECAFWFEDGRAKVTYHCTETTDEFEHTSPESDEWFYIDTQGKKLNN